MFQFSFVDLDFEGRGGRQETLQVNAGFGYMLTNHREVFGFASYFQADSTDTSSFGGAYTYNFRAGEALNPYLAAQVMVFGGEASDIFDLGYGFEFGVKVYPWSHGGAIFGVSYRQFEGTDNRQDAINTNAFGGLVLKF